VLEGIVPRQRLTGGIVLCFSLACLGLSATPLFAQSFGDTVLLSLSQDPRIQAAVTAARAGDASIDQARSAYLPQFSGQTTASRSNRDGENEQGVSRLEISQNVLNFGRRAADIGVAQEEAGLGWIEVTQVYQDVFTEVAEAYVTVLEAEEILQRRIGFVEAVAVQIVAVAEKVETGLADITVLQALSRQQAEAEVARLRATQAVDEARLVLERLIDSAPHTLEPESIAPYLALVPQNEQDVIFYAGEGAPEISIARQRFAITEARILANNRANTPALEVYGSYQRGLNLGDDSEQGEIGFRLDVPIYEGGQRAATRDVGNQQRQGALRTFQQERLLVEQSARLAWSECSVSQQALGIWVDATTTQLERLEAVQNELDLGLTEIDALLEVQSALVEVQIEQISARYAIVRAQIALLRVMGFASPVAEE